MSRFRSDAGLALCVVSADLERICDGSHTLKGKRAGEGSVCHGWEIDYPAETPQDAHAWAHVENDPFHAVDDEDQRDAVSTGFVIGSDVATTLIRPEEVC